MLVDCQNCGRQVILDGGDPDEKCYFCGKPALRKEEKNMPETMPGQNQGNDKLPEIPPKPTGSGGPGAGSINRQIGRYYDENRKQIEAEIAQYGEKQTLTRWHISSSTWKGLRDRWAGVKRGKVEKHVKKQKSKVPEKITKGESTGGKPSQDLRQTAGGLQSVVSNLVKTDKSPEPVLIIELEKGSDFVLYDTDFTSLEKWENENFWKGIGNMIRGRGLRKRGGVGNAS
jgi:hypothetical protein